MAPRSRDRDFAARRVHPLQWIWAPLEEDPTFVLRSMFGAKAVYVRGRLVLAFCAGDEPWNGVLIATERSHHESLRQEVGEFTAHPVLGKWLYLSQDAVAFESSAQRLVRLVQSRDPRIGVLPKPRRKARRSSARGLRPD
jgi:hypothetical protein